MYSLSSVSSVTCNDLRDYTSQIHRTAGDEKHRPGGRKLRSVTIGNIIVTIQSVVIIIDNNIKITTADSVFKRKARKCKLSKTTLGSK